MIPTAILLGLIGGAVPRYRWWAVPIVGIVWATILEATGDPNISFAGIWFGGFLIGSLNASIGVGVAWLLEKGIKAIVGPLTGTVRL